ncbi:hypothetical protein MKW94_005418 [Papaver nudicaule]|uniref:Glutamate receptor n=1 Tax=Papaver nudicaule TaxID=74823 RepID=A0AA41VBH3_PAPNU|nr:hypothetical protein [Papaver nudicaule]
MKYITHFYYHQLTTLFSLFFFIFHLLGGHQIAVNAQNTSNIEEFKVGVVLDALNGPYASVWLTSMNMALSDFYSSPITSHRRRLVLHVRDSNGDILDASSAAIDLIKNVQVQAIIGPTTSAAAVYVVHLGNRSQVPIISFSATSPSVSLSQNPYFIRTTLGDSSQVKTIAAIIKTFGWRQAVPIYEDTEYGNGVIPYLVDALENINTRVPYRSVLPTSASDDRIEQELHKLKSMQTRVFILHMDVTLAVRFFHKAKTVGMMSEGYSWIITDGLGFFLSSLNSSVIDTMQGVIGVIPYVPESQELSSFRAGWKKRFSIENPDIEGTLDIFGLWAYDTIWALASAVENLQSLNPEFIVGEVALNSSDVAKLGVSQIGPELLGEVSNMKMEGISGKFDLVERQLQFNNFQILNVVGNGAREIGIWTPSDGIIKDISLVGTAKNMHVSDKDNLRPIIWPGDTMVIPKGWVISTNEKKLRVGVPVKVGFTEFVKITRNSTSDPPYVTGYCIDLFKAAVDMLDYSVHYEFVPYENNEGVAAGSYNELVDQVNLQNFDVVVGDVTITANRSQFVDFTLPYAEGGVQMVVLAKPDSSKDTWIFVRPLEWKLWVTIVAYLIIIGGVIWILEHRVNREFRGGPHPAYQWGTMLSFSFSTLVFAHKERVLSSFSRIVMGVWLIVVLIVTQSYTANLTSMLTIRRLEPTYTDVRELIKYHRNVGYNKGSFVEGKLKEWGFEDSNLKSLTSPDDFDEAFSIEESKGGIVAAFEELPYIELLMARFCEKYMTVGDIDQNDGLAFVFPKGSPLGPDISRKILSVREDGKNKKIKQAWFGGKTTCPDKNSLSPSSSLKMESFYVLFVITAVVVALVMGVFSAVFLWETQDIWLYGNDPFWEKPRKLLEKFYEEDAGHLITYFEHNPGHMGNAVDAVNEQDNVVDAGREQDNTVDARNGPNNTIEAIVVEGNPTAAR